MLSMNAMLKSFWIFFILILICIPTEGFAQRPFLATEKAVPTEMKRYVLEAGLTLNRFSSDEKRSALKGTLRYGLIHNLEIALEIPYLFVDSGASEKNNLGDLSLKTKIRFLKGRVANPLSISGQMIIKFPTAGENTLLQTTGVVDVGFLAIASKKIAPVTAHINLGYAFIGNPDNSNRSDQISYSLGLEFDVMDTPLKVITEVFGYNEIEGSDTDDQLNVLSGFSYRASPELSLDAALGIGLIKNAPDYLLNFGMIYFF